MNSDCLNTGDTCLIDCHGLCGEIILYSRDIFFFPLKRYLDSLPAYNISSGSKEKMGIGPCARPPPPPPTPHTHLLFQVCWGPPACYFNVGSLLQSLDVPMSKVPCSYTTHALCHMPIDILSFCYYRPN